MSLFSVLNTGTRGLNASQMAMDVTSQNISNANVEGYSRKRLVLSADYRRDGAYGQVGMGVDVVSIERMRSKFLDDQIQRQNEEVGIFFEYNATMQGIEATFNEPSDIGILSYINRFFDSWQNLANDPSSVAARTVVRTTAETLTEKFGETSEELRILRQTRNDEIKLQVNQVNQLAEQISALNAQIGSTEITVNRKANDSRDKRDRLVKELASIIDIQVTENERGQIAINTGGGILVSPIDFQKLEITTQSFTRPDGSQYSDAGIRWAESKKSFIPEKGKIRGLLDSRDVIIPAYEEKLNTLARTLAQKVNDLHLKGYSLNGYSGFPFFDENVTGASDIKVSPAIIGDVKNIAAASGGESLPAASNTSVAGAHNFGTTIQLVRDAAVVPPIDATNIVVGSAIVTSGGVLLAENVDYHIDPVSGTFQMLHAGYDAADLTIDFQYRTNSFRGPGDNANAVAIAQLGGQLTMTPDALGNPTASFTDFYSAIVGQVGLDKNAAQTNLDTRQFLMNQYEAQQDSVAGVSLDEEMSNMVKFQRTYQAAAHMISVTDKMLDVLLNI
jgi:flagellar hook-associated protein 1 FlgK